MKLSELVNYRNQLRKMDLSSTKTTVQMDLSRVLHTVSHQSLYISDNISQLRQQEQKINQSIQDFQNHLADICQQIDQLIYEVEKPYFAESYRLYDTSFGNETLDDVKFRVPNIPESTVNFYRTRICRYIGWQHPAMIIRPGIEPYINDMISCDPLYLVDIKPDLLTPAMDSFNDVFQNRLRIYTINEQQPDPLLGKLPEAQFGLILAYNFFNFRPFEVIRCYLQELMSKLKPGGILLMTFNDCDRDKAVMLVENHFCCYTPGYLVRQLAETLGFEIEFAWHDDGPSTWLELRRPGQLHTMRGGQALAKILPKPIAESK